MFTFGIERYLIAAAVVIALLGGSFGTGYWKGYAAGVAATEAKWRKLKAEMEEASEAREAQLRERGETLAAELEAAKNKVRVQTIETVRVVYKKASATRACFSPDITEILNRNSKIRESIERPDGTTQVKEHRTEVPKGGTSELAAAEWVVHAQAAHEECRAQIGRLGDWIRAAVGSKT
jgi:hypothetical protein